MGWCPFNPLNVLSTRLDLKRFGVAALHMLNRCEAMRSCHRNASGQHVPCNNQALGFGSDAFFTSFALDRLHSSCNRCDGACGLFKGSDSRGIPLTGLLRRYILQPVETCCFFHRNKKGNHHLQGNVQVYHVRIPA